MTDDGRLTASDLQTVDDLQLLKDLHDDRMTPIHVRQCGKCHECCVHTPVAAFNKPAHTPCIHLNVLQDCGACGIYKDRPSECAMYKCSWLDGNIHEDLKPENCGILLETGEIFWPKHLKVIMGFEHVPNAIDKYFDQLKSSAVDGKIIGIVPHKDSTYFGSTEVIMFGEQADGEAWMQFMDNARRIGGVTHQFADGVVEQIIDDNEVVETTVSGGETTVRSIDIKDLE